MTLLSMKSLFIGIIVFCCSVVVLMAQDLGNVPLSLSPLESINTDRDDYAPCLSPKRDKLLFTSTRSGGNADLYMSARSNVVSETSQRSKNESQMAAGTSAEGRARASTAWSTASTVPSFNSSSNEGALSFSADGTQAVFASDRDGGSGDADIYLADVVDGEIRNSRNLGSQVNTEYWDSQPCLSADGKTIFFASTREDGIGGQDIWMSKRLPDGNWSAAQCLDRTINTERDECSPFLTSDGGTLVFASNGHAGFGAFDLFYSTRDLDASAPDWTAPTNLGGIVNSENNELFFYAANAGDNFYLSSARNLDRELDIYQGTPNLLGFGTVRISISVLDSLSGKPLPSTLQIIDVVTGAPVGAVSTTSDQLEYTVALPANRAYRVESHVPGYPSRTADVPAASANKTQHVRIAYGTVGFDFSNYQIPFFVTGYYRPNTTHNLDALFELRKTDVADANYIERFEKNSSTHKRYEEYAHTVDELFQKVVSTGVDTLFARFRSSAAPTDVLEITVVGYADPKPILGRYVESETINFVDASGNAQRVEQNDRMTNAALSGLRAVHSARELQRMFELYSKERGKDDFSALLKADRLRFKTVGGGVNTAGTDYAAQRRIKIDFSRISAGSSKSEFDSNGLRK